jgi:hypothetical protein
MATATKCMWVVNLVVLGKEIAPAYQAINILKL